MRRRNQIDKIQTPRRDEEGVALLLTLGVLALLLILGMSFMFTARTDRAAANIQSDLTKARLLADSGLERAMAALSYNHADIAGNAANVYPATKAEGLFEKVEDQFIFVSAGSGDDARLDDSLALNLGFDYIAAPSAEPTGYPNASWHHIENEDNELIGRIAFMVIDESGKIDPNAVVNFREPFIDADNSGQYTYGDDDDDGEIFYDWDNNGNYTDAPLAEGSEERWGYHPSEIDIAMAYPEEVPIGSVNPDAFRAALPSWPADVDGKWFSWQHIFRTGFMNQAQATALSRSLSPHSHDRETFWHEGNRNHRRSDVARAFGVNHAVGPRAITGQLPWLNEMVDDDGNSVADQVAVNLIDYLAEDSFATAVDFSWWDGEEEEDKYRGSWSNGDRILASATAVGVKEAPYINEVGFLIKYSTPAPDESTPRELQITVHPELVNIYPNTFNTPFVVELDVEFSGFSDFAGAQVSEPGDAEDGSTSGATFRWDVNSVSAASYEDLGGRTITYQWDADSDPDFSIQSVSVVLYYDENDIANTLYDVASTGATPDSQGLELRVFPGAPGEPNTYAENYYAISVEAMDPRSNTLARHWQWVDWEGPSSLPTSAGTLGSVNDAWDPGADDDAETPQATSDPIAGLSTAYVRNGGMKSLWELGAIHRGEPFRTVNLRAYNDGSADGTYENGDAAILDQAKLGPQNDAVGKVNVNSPIREVWNAMLAGIRVGTNGYDDAHSGGAVLSGGVVSNLTDAILNANGTDGGTARMSRGELIGAVASLSDGSLPGITQRTVREQEEIIGKIANLLTARQNYFRIVVVGQAVIDLGDVDPGGDAFSYGGSNFARVLAEQKIMAIVYRDAFTNDLTLERFEYLEE